MTLYAHKLHDIRCELSARGFVFNSDDVCWRHPNGAVISEESMADVQKYHGALVVAKLLEAIDSGAIDWSIIHSPSDTDPRALSWRIEVRPLTVLDKLAKL